MKLHLWSGGGHRTSGMLFTGIILAILTAAAWGAAPDAKTLGVPLYPGARFDEALGKVYLKLVKTPPAVYAVFTTTDDVNKVAAFYRRQIEPPAGLPASMWFPVSQDDLQTYLNAWVSAFEGTAKTRAQAAAGASKGKKIALLVQEVTARGRIISAARPFLNINGDLVDQTMITIQSIK